MYFLWFLKGNEGCDKVKKWVFNLMEGILIKWKGRNMNLWGFHGEWRIENEVSGGKKKNGKGSFAEVLNCGFL